MLISTIWSVAAEKLPLDSSVRTGRLDNGITYYIKHNASPRRQASFHLVHNIGCLAEKPSEYGAAHFLEHLMFQGTRQFPGQEMIHMLERHGVLYGHDINAVTSENKTIYMLDGVPTTDAMLLDSCMMVMAEWSHAALLEKDKIDHERSVILDEMRTRETPDRQVQNLWADVLLSGSRYVNHDVLGTADFVSEVSPRQLRRFYGQWHRPDLEAVIVVGDFDVDAMEQRLLRIMTSVPQAKGPCPLKSPYQFCHVPDQTDVRFVSARHPQAQSNSVIIINRFADTPFGEKDSRDYMRLNVIARLFNILGGKRAQTKAMEQGSPFGGATFVVAPLKRGYLTCQFGAAVKNGDEYRTLRQLLMEENRLAKVGFTEAEFAAGKSELLRDLEHDCKYSSVTNNFIMRQLESTYLDGEPMLSVEDYYLVSTDILQSLTLSELNTQVNQWISTPNKTIVVTGRPTDDAITEADARELIDRASGLDYSLYPYEMPVEPKAVPLMAAAPDTIAAASALSGRLLIKPVPADRGIVTLRAVRKGGLSVYDLDRLPAAEQAPSWVMSAGAGQFDSQQLYQQLQLHGIKADISIKSYSDEMSFSAMPNEAESLFQLMHLYFTQPHLDEQTISSIRDMSMKQNRTNALEDTIRLMRSDYSPRTLLRNHDYYAKSTAALAIQTWQERFGDPSAFTFIVTGNISTDEARRLAETYLNFPEASATPAVVSEATESAPSASVSRSKVVRMNVGRDIATVVCSFNLKGEVTAEAQAYCRILAQAFQTRAMRNIREREGGVYAINVTPSFTALPTGHYEIAAEFNCAPQDAERLRARLLEEWNSMVKEGITEEEYISSYNSLGIKIIQDGDKADFWSRAIADSITTAAPVLTPDAFAAAETDMQREGANSFLRRISQDGYTIDVIFMSTTH